MHMHSVHTCTCIHLLYMYTSTVHVPVLKAGHPVSCSCVFVLVCLVRVRGDLFSFLKFFGWCAIHMYFHVYTRIYMYVSPIKSAATHFISYKIRASRQFIQVQNLKVITTKIKQTTQVNSNSA